MGKDKKKKKSKKDSSDSSDSELERKVKKELKRLKKKEKERKEKKKLKKKSKELKTDVKSNVGSSCDINVSLMNSQAFVPMTKEAWEKQQSVLRRVYDEQTGRTRLIRGSGEVVEECVSRDRHLSINKQATKGDGEHFQKVLNSSKN